MKQTIFDQVTFLPSVTRKFSDRAETTKGCPESGHKKLWMVMHCLFLVIGLTGVLGAAPPANAQSLPTISAAPNPCASEAAGANIPVWTISGNLCITLAEYDSQSPGAWQIACPNLGTFVDGIWICNTGPRPMFSQQYLDCMDSGLGGAGLGLETELIAGLSIPSELNTALAVANLIVDHKLGWSTACAVFSAATSQPGSNLALAIASVGGDAACLLLQMFNSGGTWTPPTIQLSQPKVSGLSVSINGVMLPTTPGANIPNPAIWNFGDGSPSVNSWFPAQHSYAQAGTYKATAIAVDSNGLAQSATTTVTVSASSKQTPPTIQLSQPKVSGLSVSINGVMLPTTPGANIPNPAIWNFGDGSPSVNSWFPAQHSYAQAGTYKVTATAIDSNGLTASASVNVTVL